MHTSQDYPILQFVDKEHDRFTVGCNWINESFLLGPVCLRLIQSIDSVKIKNWPGTNRLTMLGFFLLWRKNLSFVLNELQQYSGYWLFCKCSQGALISCSEENFHTQEAWVSPARKKQSTATTSQFRGTRTTRKKIPITPNTFLLHIQLEIERSSSSYGQTYSPHGLARRGPLNRFWNEIATMITCEPKWFWNPGQFLAFIQAGHQAQPHPGNKLHKPIIFQWRNLAQNEAFDGWMAGPGAPAETYSLLCVGNSPPWRALGSGTGRDRELTLPSTCPKAMPETLESREPVQV